MYKFKAREQPEKSKLSGTLKPERNQTCGMLPYPIKIQEAGWIHSVTYPNTYNIDVSDVCTQTV